MNGWMNGWMEREASFSSDDTSLFYRAWLPRGQRAQRAVLFLHRGHEHSGRVRPLVEALVDEDCCAFAYDARGHGYSPGERGDAPSFAALVADLDRFVSHIERHYGIAASDIFIIANSVGAVVASTWLHDYARQVRGVILAAAAFSIKLYVPLAKPALRLALKFQPDLFVKSYIQPGMLTHDQAAAENYAQDPLIAKAISARILLQLADTAKRVVAQADAIDTPTLMLVAGKDLVVHQQIQRRFFEALQSPKKQWLYLEHSYHAVLYEQHMAPVFAACRSFMAECFAAPVASRQALVSAPPVIATRFPTAKSQLPIWQRSGFALQRLLLRTLGQLSDGMRMGLSQGFDSGASLDYVYKNQAQGRLLLGATLDRGYLDAIGWRGIRLRKQQLQQLLTGLLRQRADAPSTKILDIAAGNGRYVLEVAKRFQHQQLDLLMRDFSAENLDKIRSLHTELAIAAPLKLEQKDAFAADSYADSHDVDIAIVSGLFELFSDNSMVARALDGIRRQLKPGGYLIYTSQPWHPQLNLIAHTLNSHLGGQWQMRLRSQAEMDALVAAAGGVKIDTRIGLDGIFNVSVAMFSAPL